MYTCSKCNLSVIVTEKGEVMKACKCQAPIIGNMSAIVYSQSSLRQTK